MRYLEIVALVPDCSPAEIYSTLSDFNLYPEKSKEVRSVKIEMQSDGQMISSWETNFRGGILRWVEQDFFDPEAGTIGFVQTEGDIDHFSGQWKIEEHNNGGLIRFTAQFDMGMPSLSKIIDPIAEQALRENIQAIIEGLFGPDVEFPSESIASTLEGMETVKVFSAE